MHPHNHVHNHQPMGAVRTMQMIQVQTPQGVQWVPYNPQAIGQATTAAAPAPSGLSSLLTGLLPKVAVGVALFFAGKWAYGKIKKHEAARLEEDERDYAAEEGAEEEPSYIATHERRRSAHRLLKEVKRFAEAHAGEE